MYGLVLSSAPVTEPVSLTELKTWLRRDDSDDDTAITALGAAARRLVENRLGRQLVTATWVLTLDTFPRAGGWAFLESPMIFPDPHTIRLPKAPLQSVQSVEYYDLGDNLLTLASTVYDVDIRTDPGRILLAQNQVWPVTRFKPGAVRVTFTAGYGGASSVPEQVKTAIKMTAAFWYENRGEAIESAGVALPLAVETILANEWNGELEYGL